MSKEYVNQTINAINEEIAILQHALATNYYANEINREEKEASVREYIERLYRIQADIDNVIIRKRHSEFI